MKTWLPLLPLTLLLAACDSGPSAPAPTDPPVTQVTGQVDSGTGSGTVELLDQGTTGSVLASATVGSDGSFVLPLPAAEKFASRMVSADSVLGQVGCQGTLTSSTPGTRGYGFAELRATRSGSVMQVVNLNADLNLLPPHVAFNGHAWVYTDQSTLLQGRVDCTKLLNASGTISQLTVDVNVQTRAGWNVIEIAGRTAGVSLPTTASASATAIKDFTGSRWRTVTDVARSITSLSAQAR